MDFDLMISPLVTSMRWALHRPRSAGKVNILTGMDLAAAFQKRPKTNNRSSDLSNWLPTQFVTNASANADFDQGRMIETVAT